MVSPTRWAGSVLGRLRDSAIVARLAMRMPLGTLAILAVTALHGTMTKDPNGTWYAPLAAAVHGAVLDTL